MKIQTLVASLALTLPVLAGCRANETLNPPAAPPPPAAGAMFVRYVSMGNSITAGFQSAGINDSTQARGYAMLLANAMGTSFVRPSLYGRGCPPPYTNNVTGVRVGGDTSSTTCDLRVSNAIPDNVAVPGARAEELLSNLGVPTSNSNALTLLFLGGKTQTEVMQEKNPTFVSVWAGNNDVLGALTERPSPSNPTANPGDMALVTTPAAFAVQYDSIADAVAATGAKVVLISVGYVSDIPYASSAVIYYCLKNGGCPPPLPPQDPQFAAIPTFTVSVNCAPPGGLPVLVPWPIGLTKLKTAVAGTPASIDCSKDGEVITAAEHGHLDSAVTAYNLHIDSVATKHGWAYLDVNPTLIALKNNGTIPAFPNAKPALAGQPVTFGTLFSLDGVHPSSLAHRIIADSVASAINQKYGTTIPVPVCNATTNCPAP